MVGTVYCYVAKRRCVNRHTVMFPTSFRRMDSSVVVKGPAKDQELTGSLPPTYVGGYSPPVCILIYTLHPVR